MEDCIFCRMARGEIPTDIVYQNDAVMAFRDIHPQAPVHVLIIPRAHHAHIGDSVPRETLADLFSAVPKVAQAAGVADSGYRLIVNTGADASQTVKHLHIHLMGGAPMSEGMVTCDE